MARKRSLKLIAIVLVILLTLSSCQVLAVTNYDLRDHITVHIKDQGNTGACWLLAMSTVIETNLLTKNNINTQVSARHMDYATSQSFLNNQYNEYGFSKEVNTGGTAELALAYLTNGSGPIEEEEMPFSDTFGDIDLREITSKKTKLQIDKWVAFPRITKQKLNNTLIYKNEEGKEYTQEEINAIRSKIKTHIMENGAIYTGTHASTDFDKFYNLSTKAYNCNDATKLTDHAIAIIGWDDNYSKDNFNNSSKPQHDGAYIVQNSWGNDDRLNNGTYYISYEDAIIEKEIYGIVDIKNKIYDNIYQYDELGRNQYFEISGTNQAYGANVFKRSVTEDETLTHIGISTYMDVDYEIYINTAGASFEEENVIKAGEGRLEAGYNTVYLSEPLKLTGDKFTIIVKYKKVGDVLGITSISRHEGIGNTAPYQNITSNPEESYIGNNLENMKDLYTFGGKNTNLCIKGFTKSQNTLIKGDVNGSGKITALDLSLLKAHIVKIKLLPDIERGDMNGDGIISAIDLSKLKKVIVGLED